MSESSIHILGWVLIAAIWAFVLIGGWHTIRELRTVLRARRRSCPSRQGVMPTSGLVARRF